MRGSIRKLWKVLFIEAFGSGRLIGLVAAIIILDVAPSPGSNLDRCKNEVPTPLLELEVVASETELPIGETMGVEAIGRWENGDNERVETAQWSASPQGIVDLEIPTTVYDQGYVQITGLAEGVVTITAVVDEIEGSIQITVVPSQ